MLWVFINTGLVSFGGGISDMIFRDQPIFNVLFTDMALACIQRKGSSVLKLFIPS